MNGIPSQGHEAVLLDTRELALRCMNLDRAFQAQVQRTESLEKQLQVLETERSGSEALRQLGLAEVQRMQRDCRARLRAIVQHTGDESRLRALDTVLNESSPDPETLQRMHRELSAEFTALYPTQPRSRETGSMLQGDPSKQWNAFQMAPGSPR